MRARALFRWREVRTTRGPVNKPLRVFFFRPDSYRRCDYQLTPEHYVFEIFTGNPGILCENTDNTLGLPPLSLSVAKGGKSLTRLVGRARWAPLAAA